MRFSKPVLLIGVVIFACPWLLTHFRSTEIYFTNMLGFHYVGAINGSVCLDSLFTSPKYQREEFHFREYERGSQPSILKTVAGEFAWEMSVTMKKTRVHVVFPIWLVGVSILGLFLVVRFSNMDSVDQVSGGKSGQGG